MSVPAFYDNWLDNGLFGLPRYPKIMLCIYLKFIERKHRKAFVQGREFDEEAMFIKEFTLEKQNAI